jgi:hypothetical protein
MRKITDNWHRQGRLHGEKERSFIILAQEKGKVTIFETVSL